MLVEIQIARLFVQQRCHSRVEVELDLSIFIVQEHGLAVTMTRIGCTSGVSVRKCEVRCVAISLGFEVGSRIVSLVHIDQITFRGVDDRFAVLPVRTSRRHEEVISGILGGFAYDVQLRRSYGRAFELKMRP